MRDHTKLRSVELADEVAILIYRVTAGFPKDELSGLTAKLRRVSVSVLSGIVDDCARDSEADSLRFLNIAFGLQPSAYSLPRHLKNLSPYRRRY